MTQLTPWRSPMNALTRSPFENWLQSIFGEARMPSVFSETRFPRADIAETENAYVYSVELPGMKEEDVEVSVAGDRLVISGERKHKSEKKEKQFHRVETVYGTFERVFELPATARKDPESIEATFKNGMLEIEVAKVEPRPVAKVKVKAR